MIKCPFTSFLKYHSECKKIEEMKEKKESFEDLELLQYQYDELEKANIQENEIEEIEEELKKLESFEEISNLVDSFNKSYDQISTILYSTKKSLGSLKNDIFSEEADKINEFYYALDDINDSINQKFSKISSNQYRLEELKERKSLLYGLRRKYGRTTSDILNYFSSIKDEIELITNYDYLLEKQQNTINQIKGQLSSIALSIREIRQITLSMLEKEVNIQLKDLLLENSDFKINLEEVELNKNGIDNITFKLCANKGGKYLSLSSTASLGETSRIHLALKTVFNKIKPVGTMIFDEIDTGISGKVAIGVSNKIYDISRESQTLVITHLPQVAAKGENHYFVSKIVEDDKTKTKIRELSSNEVIENIAYMMTGDNPTKESLTLANQLIESMK